MTPLARSAILWSIRWLLGGHGGNIGALTAILIIPLAGAFALGTEGASWFLINRAEQNAADAAVLAAAANDDAENGGTGYISEAKAVASRYGFTNGVDNTVVTVGFTTIASVPTCAMSSCYTVTITKNTPLFLAEIVGYAGNVKVGGKNGQSIQAGAVASPISINSYCVLSLSSGPNSIHVDGGPKTDFAGCVLRADGNVTCDGANSNGGARLIVYTGSNSKCTPDQSDPTATGDPYAAQNASIPVNPCGNAANNFPQEPAKKTDPPLPATNLLSGALSWTGNKFICGDAQLTGNVQVSSPGGAPPVLIVENGKLDLNGFALQTAAGTGMTIIFSGPTIAGLSPSHIPTGTGTLQIAAPKSGTWSGDAIWQDNALKSGVDISYNGNNPTWDITGLVYVPNSNVSITGAVGKDGLSCFALVDYTLSLSGTGAIFQDPQSQCRQAGLNPPAGPITRQTLVF